jgi:hypothetical protein
MTSRLLQRLWSKRRPHWPKPTLAALRRGSLATLQDHERERALLFPFFVWCLVGWAVDRRPVRACRGCPDTPQVHPCRLGGGRPWPPTVRAAPAGTYRTTIGALNRHQTKSCWGGGAGTRVGAAFCKADRRIAVADLALKGASRGQGEGFGTVGDMDVAKEPTWTYSRRVPKPSRCSLEAA